MTHIRNLRKAFLVSVLIAAAAVTGHAAAGAIQTISPGAARSGDVVTITGQGFGAMNVRVTVGGVRADVLSANGNTVTFRIPSGLRPGIAAVVATNPGGRSGTIDFTILDGILLPGGAASLMKDAAFDLFPATALSADQIVHNTALTQLEVFFSPAVTVAQVNDALRRVNGGIVGMSKGLTTVTIAVPRAATVAAIEAIADTLKHAPGVQFATVGHLPRPAIVFTETPPDEPGFALSVAFMHYLVPSRFPAAWNALPRGFLGGGLCPVTPVSVLVADLFASRANGATGLLPPTLHGPANPTPGFPAADLAHGYLVSNVVAAMANETVVGANPFGALRCIDLTLVQQAGHLPNLATDSIVHSLPANQKAIVNYSMGFAGECAAEHCAAPHDQLIDAHERAWEAKYWKEKTKSRWADFLMVVAAGNARDKESATIYPGTSDARFGSEMAIAQLPDTRMTFGTSSIWQPDPAFLPFGFDSLAMDAGDSQLLAGTLDSLGLTGPDSIADNVIVVGSATRQTPSSLLTQHVTGDQLGESVFSNANADVLAVGEEIFDDALLNGTSFSAPVVTGLASYLWMISPDLRDEPASKTKQAIVANARNRVVDAYATVLSLDPGLAAAATMAPGTMPIRETLLDVDQDGKFTEADIAIFMGVFFRHAPDGSIIGPALDTRKNFSRADLNGDGFTTAGARRERFDLDRVNSTQFGATNYSPSVKQTIDGEEVNFDENALTDLEILCYYAYSPLFAGVSEVRDSQLEGRCNVSVTPRTVRLARGQRQQFTAHVPDNGPIDWSTNAPDGGVSSTGLFTAGATTGTFKVRATDVNDPSVFAEATVTVDASSGDFRAHETITVGTGGTDPLTFESLFSPRVFADNVSAAVPPLPIEIDQPGSYHHDNFTDATFTLKADANFPVAGQFLVPASGTHSATVSCVTEAGRGPGPRIGSFASGTLNVQAVGEDGRTPADISIVLGGEVVRGPGAGDLNGRASYSGSVRVSWTTGGVQQKSFTIKAVDYASNPAGSIPTAIDRTLDIKAPGFVDIQWDINAACQSGGVDGNNVNEVDKASGSLSLTYTLLRR